MKTQQEKRHLHLRVPVRMQEGDTIKINAKNCGLSVSAYLRQLGLGYVPPSIIDNHKIDDLLRINGDLGRLGGLLKLWLSSDRHAAHFTKSDIRAVLTKIENNQAKLRQAVAKITR